ncbi:hypothetical protein [Methanobacterium alcaliphilum]|uniref:hypothetical protein n=1 Tax=Methanobacterium alcaliphilum TaxID=392018 RepID=UPI00200AE6A8|nr:hypothetical protein [Methanobacterium alcaliphilum]MCK9150723.1 hypothetical protein [Methanobacterium alcaliphilum]
MKKYVIFVLFLVLIVMSSGCINTDTSTNQTFNKSGVFFTYPGEWSEMNLTDLKNLSLSPESAIGGVISDNETLIVAIHRYPSEGISASTLKGRLKTIYASENISNITAIDIGGKKGFVANTSAKGESKKIVTVLTSKYIYLFEFWSKTTDFSDMQTSINEIISSIQIS